MQDIVTVRGKAVSTTGLAMELMFIAVQKITGSYNKSIPQYEKEEYMNNYLLIYDK